MKNNNDELLIKYIMRTRREFIKNSALVAGGLVISSNTIAGNVFKPASAGYTSNRPKPELRKFTSSAVERTIAEVKVNIANPELAWMFENCFPNTLDTTVNFRLENGKPFTYVITGDIDAMWLRDSSAQVWPYLPLVKNDKPLQDLIAGVVNQHAAFVLLDPYANAFYDDPKRVSEWKDDNTEMRPGVHERKWEVDSLCYVIRLAYHYWKYTDDTQLFDTNWVAAMKLIVKTFKEQQRKENVGPYRFMRGWEACIEDGWGVPVNPTGMIFSAFRPSDDRTVFPFLISSNLFAVVSLRQLSEIFSKTGLDAAFAKECSALADEVHEAITRFGIVDFNNEKVFAYEVDGFGSQYFADDANVPSLLSLTYIGAVKSNDPIYINTRKMLLNEKTNPYYVKGKVAEGISSPHCYRENIWPMSIILRAMTSVNDEEIIMCLKMLRETHANTGFMHESFNKDDASKFTRKWFAWANTLFGELILKISLEKPHLLKNK
jgi:meiotically up-regulated gene 157 (Mug157) protein